MLSVSLWRACLLACVVLSCFGAAASGSPVARAQLMAANGSDSSGEIRQLVQQALALQEAGRLTDAEAAMRRAIDLQASERSSAAALPILRYFLASIYVDEGRFDDAEPILKDVIAALGARGANDLALVSPLSTLGNMYMRQGRYAEAEPLLERSLRIAEKAPGNDKRDVATVLENLATLMEKTNRREEADALTARAAAIRGLRR